MTRAPEIQNCSPPPTQRDVRSQPAPTHGALLLRTGGVMHGAKTTTALAQAHTRRETNQYARHMSYQDLVRTSRASRLTWLSKTFIEHCSSRETIKAARHVILKGRAREFDLSSFARRGSIICACKQRKFDEWFCCRIAYSYDSALSANCSCGQSGLYEPRPLCLSCFRLCHSVFIPITDDSVRLVSYL